MVVMYPNGNKVQCLLVAQAANAFQVAVAGDENLRMFRRIEGVWHTEDGQPVQITPHGRDDIRFICSPEQGQQLIARLIDGSEELGSAPGPLFVFSPEDRNVQVTVLRPDECLPR
jgi:hypothetical protein